MTDRRRVAALGASLALVWTLGLGGPGSRAAADRADVAARPEAAVSDADATGAPEPAGPARTDYGVLLSSAPRASSDAPSALPPRAPATAGASRLVRLWLGSPAGPDRVERTGSAARQLGLTSYDAAGRALLLATGPAAAEDAVRVAPGLPWAEGAVARSRLGAGDPIGAASALASGVVDLDRHLEASLWLRVHAFDALAFAGIWGGFAFLLVAGAANLRRAAHDVGDVLSDAMPSWQRLLLVGGLVLLPASFGQGAFGLALGLTGVCLAGGDPRLRPAVAGAALACVLGAQPVLDATARALAAFDADPVALAAWSVESGSAGSGELSRLAAAEASDPLARRALAVHARRLGDLAGADARYAALVDAPEVDEALLNNAANVRFARGRLDEALPLYVEATAHDRSAVVFFNLAQAYGSEIRSTEQDLALAKAQALDRALVGELTALEPAPDTGLAVDLPTPPRRLRARLLASPSAPEIARELRAGFAPGALGRGPLPMGIAFLGVGVASVLATRAHAPSRACRHCGTRCCPRCDDPAEGAAVCRDCARLSHRKDGPDAGRRQEQLARIRARERRQRPLWLAASLGLPAVAGLRGRRPLLGLASALGLALALGASPLAPALAPDPFAAGLPGRAALGALVLLGLALHLASVGLARRGGRA